MELTRCLKWGKLEWLVHCQRALQRVILSYTVGSKNSESQCLEY